MADRRIRTILEAQADSLIKGLRDSARAAKDTAGDLEDLEKRAKALDSLKAKVQVDADADKAEKSIEKVGDELDKINGETATADVQVDSNKAEQSVEQVADQLARIDGETATAKVAADASRADGALDQITRKVAQLDGEGANIKVDADTSGAVDAIDADIPKAGRTAGGKAGDALGGGLKGGFKVGLGALGGLAAAGGLAIGAALWSSLQRGLEKEAGRGLFSAKTGLDEATAAKFGRAAGSAYAQAWGASIEANMDTARAAMQNGLLSESDSEATITAMIAQLSAVTDIIGADIPEAARAAGQMIKTGLADNAQEAFDTIVAGYQSGVDASDDMIDTIIEYGTHFRDLGLTGAEALGLVNQGLEAGAFNGDKVADALKELTIRVKDVNDQAAGDALGKLGLSHQKMADAFAAGGPKAREALDSILDGLNGIEDPAERSATAVALFGTQAEDMAGALSSLDLDTAAAGLGNFEGAAKRAMDSMSSNTATAMESAKRSVEVAFDQIAGILATAFSDDLGGMAEWVAENRAKIIEFAVVVTQALVDAGRASGDFAAMMIRGLGLAAGAAAPLVHAIGGIVVGLGILRNDTTMQKFGDDMVASAKGMTTFAENADTMAEGVKGAINGAMDATEARIMGWAGDELLSAQISDAVVMSTRRLGELATAIDNTEGTVTINGEAVNAERALDAIVANIDSSDGTVTINGDRVPAGQALDTMIRLINAGKGAITIGGNASPARSEADAAARYASSKRPTMTIDANGAAALREAEAIRRRIASNPAYIPVRSSSTIARANGGWIPGKAAGGWVPGPYPGKGVDNILWPLAYGGRTLDQPLAGGEFVVNTMSSREWAPFLEAINGGLKPSDISGRPEPAATVVYVQNPWTGEYLEGRVAAVSQRTVNSRLAGARRL